MAATPPAHIFIDAVPGETRAARMVDDRLIDLIIERDGSEAKTGAIYMGRVVRVVKALNAAFVDLGGTQGFLPLGKSDAPHEGEALLVQISRAAHDDKEAKLTRALEISSPLCVLTPLLDEVGLSRKITAAGARQRLSDLIAQWRADAGYSGGLLLRTQAASATDDELTSQLNAALSHWRKAEANTNTVKAPGRVLAAPGQVARFIAHLEPNTPVICDHLALANRIKAEHPHLVDLAVHNAKTALFTDLAIEQEIEAALSTTVPLPGGGNLIIEPTEALIAIDVNAGAGSTASQDAKGGAHRASTTASATNHDAIIETARQLRLRNLGGKILIDLLPMEKGAARDRLLASAKSQFADDPAVSVAGLTRLGLLELTRSRNGPSLAERMDATGAAYGLLRAVQASARAQPRARFAVRAAAEIVKALNATANPARRELEQALGTPIELTAMPNFAVGQFDITN